MISLICAIIIVLCLLIVTPVLTGMYLDIHKAEIRVNKKLSEIDAQLNKLNKESQ